jgi:hypothetical protein
MRPAAAAWREGGCLPKVPERARSSRFNPVSSISM